MNINYYLENKLSFDEILENWENWKWDKWPLVIDLINSTHIVPELVNRPIEHIRRFLLGYYTTEGIRQFLLKKRIFDTLNYNEEGDYYLRRGQPSKALPDLNDNKNSYEIKCCHYLKGGYQLDKSYRLHNTDYVICYEYDYDQLYLLDNTGRKIKTYFDDDGNIYKLKYGMPLLDKLINEIDINKEAQIAAIIDF